MMARAEEARPFAGEKGPGGIPVRVAVMVRVKEGVERAVKRGAEGARERTPVTG